MEKYYKYTSIVYIEKALEYGVYASQLKDVNDPYESEGIVQPEDFRICCMTTSPKKMLMWAYYTNHRGCCIEYELENSEEMKSIVRTVNYTKSYEQHREMDEKEIKNALYKKGSEWEHEKEVRAVWRRKDHNSLWVEVGNAVYLRARVKSVSFGLFVSDGEEYKEALEAIHDYNRQKTQTERVKVNKLMLSNKKYGLVQDKQYDYERELERLNSGQANN